MGQQQLLLVILVTIIVGIATVVAINTFSSAANSANMDAVRQDLASAAAGAQGYYMKPKMLGGGGKDFTGMSFRDIAFGGTISTDTKAYNANGTYVLGGGASGSITVTAYPSSDNGYAGDGSTAGGSMVYTIYPDSAEVTTAYVPGS